ncbi:MAG: metal-dependent hydrolase [Candidatus Aminicenantes bacterium]|nr:metal-dependent hydrolase [Candidatus Aminicenantes bacterium]
MQITWLGHSAVKIKGTKTIYIDPFLSENPAAVTSPEQVTEADIVIVTHDHSDHLGDAFPICKKTGATLVGIHEIAVMAEAEGITAEGMNIGGTVEVKGVKVHMVQALHSCEQGDPAGVVVEMDNKTLYHAGDTALTYDMKLIAEFFLPDLSFLPIGDRYTMGIHSAAKAVEFTQTKKVIPIHYDTFPLVDADPEEFKKQVGDKAEVIILKPGETHSLP